MAANVKRTRELDGTVLFTNVATNKTAGKLVVIGELVCCHKADQLASATKCPVWIDGVEILYAKEPTTDVVTMGQLLYFDDVNDWLTTVASTFKKAGCAVAAAASTVTTVKCHLGLWR